MVTGFQSNTNIWNKAQSYLNVKGTTGTLTQVSSSDIASLRLLDGKVIKDSSTGNVYEIHVNDASASGMETLDESSYEGQALLSQINGDITRAWDYVIAPNAEVHGNVAASDVQVGFGVDCYNITLTQLLRRVSIEIDYDRQHVVDAPYDIFCIPYSDDLYLWYSGGAMNQKYIKCDKNMAVMMAQEIARDAGSGSIYDTQLLPYCPSQELASLGFIGDLGEDILDIRNFSKDFMYLSDASYSQVSSINNQTSLDAAIAQYGEIYDKDHNIIYYYSANTTYWRKVPQGDPIGAIMWCSSSTRTFKINAPISAPANALEAKVQNECDLYRLCSGNYAGAFEFSVAKSGGVAKYRVDCTFKPYNPYIHVVPELGGLYGDFASFKDSNGLICGGDFSLAQMTNAWANYELTNKNYQAIFDRQIQNMDVNNSIARTEAAWQAAAGAITGTSAGAIAGAKGGPAGAIAGALLGGTLATAGGIADYELLKQRQEEAKSYATDMYGYQLGNIKAIPTSLSKTAAMNANTKIFPFIEYYTCTDAEKEALRNKIRYDGMTVMKIAKMSEFESSAGQPKTKMFRGDLININTDWTDSNNADAWHRDCATADAIYQELKKGVYI